MDIFQILKKDHQTVKEIFKKLEETTPRGIKSREKLFSQLKNEVEAHSHGEEATFYAVLKEHSEMQENVEEAMDEHETVATLLEEMEEMEKDSEEWSSKLREIKKNVLHHVKEEEGEIFKKAKTLLSKDQLQDLGKEFQNAKKKAAAE